MASAVARSKQPVRDVALLILVCHRPSAERGLLGTVQSKNECRSAAMQLMMHNREAFNGILKRNNVAVDDDGMITLPMIKNIVPYEGISSPSAVFGKGPSGSESYQPKIKDSMDGVDSTLDDLGSLLDLLGTNELNVKGICGGKSYAPGGPHYHAEWTDGWMKVAEKRAFALLERLGMSEKSGVTVDGRFRREDRRGNHGHLVDEDLSYEEPRFHT